MVGEKGPDTAVTAGGEEGQWGQSQGEESDSTSVRSGDQRGKPPGQKEDRAR